MSRVVIASYADRDRYVRSILAEPNIDPTDKVVLIGVAYHVNCKTGQCNPAAATLARETALHERTVQRTVKGLEAKGWLFVDRTRGRRRISSR